MKNILAPFVLILTLPLLFVAGVFLMVAFIFRFAVDAIMDIVNWMLVVSAPEGVKKYL